MGAGHYQLPRAVPVTDGRLPADVMQLVREKERALKAGTLVLNPSTERPTDLPP